jgi:glycosyltransferase involved in cell wall biosynthesis
MRIAYLTGEYPRATDTFIQREVEALRKQGVEVYTFSVRRPGDEQIVGPEQETERQNTFYILSPDLLFLLFAHITLILSSPTRYLRALRLAWSTRQPGLRGLIYQLIYFTEAGTLARKVSVLNIQHLHNHLATSSGTVAMIASELGDFTFSFTLHGPYIFFEPYRWALEEKIKRALFVCCISYFCRSQAMVFAPLSKWEKMHIIHCGVDPDLFSLVSHQASTKRLLYIGRLASVKGLPILIESLGLLKELHPTVTLTIVGDGPDRFELEQLTEKFNLKESVRFVGYQSQSSVRQFIQQTDVFVLPSFAEGVPVVLMEAMAAGLPVVTTRIAGISELVEDGISGYLVPPGDAASLAKSISLLLDDHELRKLMGKAGRAKVQQEFNLQWESERLYRVIDSALQGKAEPVRPSCMEMEALAMSQV